MSADSRVPNILTVDVEDWFHVLEAEGAPDRAKWASLESRVERNTEGLLALLEREAVGATFFVVGWIAWRYPGLVRRIADAGHEVASHSFWHEVMGRHHRDSLREDVGASRRLLEDLTGAPVRGFRAPGGSITPETAWVFDVLTEAGYAYDSSLCPGLSSHGGFPSPWHGPHRVRCNAGELAEIPSSTVGLGGRRLPYAGGGYLRLLPGAVIRALIALDNRSGRPANVYVHPREIDPDQPRMSLAPLRRFKYYVGLRSTERKLESLLARFHFLPASAWLEAHGEALRTRVLDVRTAAARGGADANPTTRPPSPSVLLDQRSAS